MKITRLIAFIVLTVIAIAPFAHAINNPTLPVNEPTVSAITSTTATVSVPPEILNTLSAEQKAGLYFEYIPTQQVCIMIYPTPANCLPKKTALGQTTTTLTGLTANTSYTVSYKKDNTIACITTPCPENGLQSGSVEFTTKTIDTTTTILSRNLKYRSRGSDVVILQDVLQSFNYLRGPSSGFFGVATLKAVKNFQKNYMHIAPTGFVGERTRASINDLYSHGAIEAQFSGVIQSVSTGCYTDGVCSVTIDGKKVITTIGWSQAVVGSIKGSVNNIGDIETSKIGAMASVFANKTIDGYTLYGSSAYYIDVK